MTDGGATRFWRAGAEITKPSTLYSATLFVVVPSTMISSFLPFGKRCACEDLLRACSHEFRIQLPTSSIEVQGDVNRSPIVVPFGHWVDNIVTIK